jgi:hypothetical protein
MKTTKCMLGALLAGSLLGNQLDAAPPSDSARQYIIALSPNLERAAREGVYREIAGLGIEAGLPEDRILVIDGLRLELIATLSIPAGDLYRKNANARARALAPGLATLRQALSAEVPHPPAMASVIHAPQILALASTHLRRPGQAITVVLVGSAFYADEDSVLDMLGGYVPSDEHLRSSSRRSVYGTADKREGLQGVTVHYAYLRESFEHDEHRDAVSRFWCLFVQSQQGVLASFAASPTVVFQRVKAGVQDRVISATLDDSDHEFVMRRVQHKKVEVSSSRTNAIAHAASEITAPKVVVAPSPMPNVGAGLLATNSELLTSVIPSTLRAGKSGVAIAWAVNGHASPGVDVDLYTQAPNCPIELNYTCKSAPWGRYLRDVQNATGTSLDTSHARDDWEYVELEPIVSLSDASVWLDLYRNDGEQAIEGVIILVTEGRVHQDGFSFPSGLSGDQAAHASSRHDNPNWRRIDLARILNHG